jgi:hypothetical protein
MFELQMLIPVADNEGDVFPASAFLAFEQAAIDCFGGFSRLPGTNTGGWISPDGRLYRDDAYVYAFVLRSVTDGERVGSLVGFAKTLFSQEAIFIRYLGVIEIL